MAQKTFLVDGSCYISKIDKTIYFRYKIIASSGAQAGLYCIEDIKKFFSTSEYLEPEFRELVGMDSTLNYARRDLSYNFVPYLKRSIISPRALIVECNKDGSLKDSRDKVLLQDKEEQVLTEEECMEKYGMTLQEYKDFPF